MAALPGRETQPGLGGPREKEAEAGAELEARGWASLPPPPPPPATGMAAKSSTPKTPSLSVSARKIKDNAADWHNLIMKWETLNNNGFTTATKIVNIKIATESKENKLEIEHDDISSEPGKLSSDYNVELEACCTELLEIFKNMVKIHHKMERLCSTTKGICNLETYHHGDHAKPFFHTWPTPYFYEVSVKLLDMYSNELKLKETIVQEIAHTADQNLMMVYLSSWLYQPYIENTSTVLLESMLLETGHRPA
ncbi:cyclin-dependent kinase 2-interacting protein isoform X2 [Anolis carolinensis]|uniref:cyclin-dependent kinase 2-interacting protein isoform X2 n=1 Tax=Anolis carolinensis TaxID=28377 RepID=UPI002F2B328A